MDKFYRTYLFILIFLICFFCKTKLLLNKMLILKIVEENCRGFIEKLCDRKRMEE